MPYKIKFEINDHAGSPWEIWNGSQLISGHATKQEAEEQLDVLYWTISISIVGNSPPI